MNHKEQILRRTDHGLDVFRYYLGSDVRPGKRFRSPLYRDTRPSCNLYFDKRAGLYRLKDFGNEELSGDCFWLVGQLHGLNCNNSEDFVRILEIIDRDLRLGLSAPSRGGITPVPVEIPTSPANAPHKTTPRPFRLTIRRFTSAELAYWQQYGITPRLLERYDVVAVRFFESINQQGRPYSLVSSPAEPIFGYIGPGNQYVKLYRPFSTNRFIFGGDCGDYYCFGRNQLPERGDRLYITGGEKDVLTLTAHGFNAVCFGSETVNISQSAIASLNNRFGQILILYDCDATGLRSAQAQQRRLGAHRVGRVTLPLAGTKQEKDISDFFRLGHTADELERITPDYTKPLTQKQHGGF